MSESNNIRAMLQVPTNRRIMAELLAWEILGDVSKNVDSDSAEAARDDVLRTVDNLIAGGITLGGSDVVLEAEVAGLVLASLRAAADRLRSTTTDGDASRLWLLGLTGEGDKGPPFGCAVGHVVRATTERLAREAAGRGAGLEGGEFWLNPALSTCVELLPHGVPGVVLSDQYGC